MWGLITGVVSYFPFAWYSHRYLDDHGMPPGFSRRLLVIIVASVLSTGLGYGVSRLTSSPQHLQAESQMQKKTMQLLGSTLHCVNEPSNPQCQQNAAEAHQLLQQMLKTETGKQQQG